MTCPAGQHPNGSGHTVRLASPPMPPRKGLEGHPRLHLAPGGTWPDGPLRDDAPDAARLAQHIAKEFRDHYQRVNWTPTKAAKRLRMSRTIVYNILSGDTWLDLPTVVRIEQALGRRLWTSDHLAPTRSPPTEPTEDAQN